MEAKNTEPTVEAALAELREMFPKEQIVVSVRAIKRYVDYQIQVGVNGKDFDCFRLGQGMRKVRQWKETMSKSDAG